MYHSKVRVPFDSRELLHTSNTIMELKVYKGKRPKKFTFTIYCKAAEGGTRTRNLEVISYKSHTLYLREIRKS